MKSWLVAKAEEEKTKQEEEKTRQEQLRLEQRKIEGDILRSSLSGGIPPPLIPLVFAGMGSNAGAASKTALEWAQQYLSTSQAHHPQLLPAAAVSPEHQRDYTTQSGSHYTTGTPGPGGGLATQGSFTSHAGSPTRPRGQTMSGPLGRVGSGLSSFPTGASSQGPGPVSHQQQGHGHLQQGQQEAPLYFHHWQPPSTQGGASSNPPGTPSGSSKTKRKRDSL